MKPLNAPHLTNLLKDGLIYYRYPGVLASRHWVLKKPTSPELATEWKGLVRQAQSHAGVEYGASFVYDYTQRRNHPANTIPEYTLPRWSGAYVGVSRFTAQLDKRGNVTRLGDFQPGYLLPLIRVGFSLGEPADETPCALILDGSKVVGLLMKMRPNGEE